MADFYDPASPTEDEAALEAKQDVDSAIESSSSTSAPAAPSTKPAMFTARSFMDVEHTPTKSVSSHQDPGFCPTPASPVSRFHSAVHSQIPAEPSVPAMNEFPAIDLDSVPLPPMPPQSKNWGQSSIPQPPSPPSPPVIRRGKKKKKNKRKEEEPPPPPPPKRRSRKRGSQNSSKSYDYQPPIHEESLPPPPPPPPSIPETELGSAAKPIEVEEQSLAQQLLSKAISSSILEEKTLEMSKVQTPVKPIGVKGKVSFQIKSFKKPIVPVAEGEADEDVENENEAPAVDSPVPPKIPFKLDAFDEEDDDTEVIPVRFKVLKKHDMFRPDVKETKSSIPEVIQHTAKEAKELALKYKEVLEKALRESGATDMSPSQSSEKAAANSDSNLAIQQTESGEAQNSDRFDCNTESNPKKEESESGMKRSSRHTGNSSPDRRSSRYRRSHSGERDRKKSPTRDRMRQRSPDRDRYHKRDPFSKRERSRTPDRIRSRRSRASRDRSRSRSADRVRSRRGRRSLDRDKSQSPLDRTHSRRRSSRSRSPVRSRNRHGRSPLRKRSRSRSPYRVYSRRRGPSSSRSRSGSRSSTERIYSSKSRRSPLRGRSRTPDRSKSPVRRRSKTPDMSKTPDRKRSKTPDRKRSKTPERRSITPDRRSKSPDRSTTPDRQRSRTRTPEREKSMTPERQKSSTSVEQRSTTPDRITSIRSEKQKSVTPDREMSKMTKEASKHENKILQNANEEVIFKSEMKMDVEENVPMADDFKVDLKMRLSRVTEPDKLEDQSISQNYNDDSHENQDVTELKKDDHSKATVHTEIVHKGLELEKPGLDASEALTPVIKADVIHGEDHTKVSIKRTTSEEDASLASVKARLSELWSLPLEPVIPLKEKSVSKVRSKSDTEKIFKTKSKKLFLKSESRSKGELVEACEIQKDGKENDSVDILEGKHKSEILEELGVEHKGGKVNIESVDSSKTVFGNEIQSGGIVKKASFDKDSVMNKTEVFIDSSASEVKRVIQEVKSEVQTTKDVTSDVQKPNKARKISGDTNEVRMENKALVKTSASSTHRDGKGKRISVDKSEDRSENAIQAEASSYRGGRGKSTSVDKRDSKTESEVLVPTEVLVYHQYEKSKWEDTDSSELTDSNVREFSRFDDRYRPRERSWSDQKDRMSALDKSSKYSKQFDDKPITKRRSGWDDTSRLHRKPDKYGSARKDDKYQTDATDKHIPYERDYKYRTKRSHKDYYSESYSEKSKSKSQSWSRSSDTSGNTKAVESLKKGSVREQGEGDSAKVIVPGGFSSIVSAYGSDSSEDSNLSPGEPELKKTSNFKDTCDSQTKRDDGKNVTVKTESQSKFRSKEMKFESKNIVEPDYKSAFSDNENKNNSTINYSPAEKTECSPHDPLNCEIDTKSFIKVVVADSSDMRQPGPAFLDYSAKPAMMSSDEDKSCYIDQVGSDCSAESDDDSKISSPPPLPPPLPRSPPPSPPSFQPQQPCEPSSPQPSTPPPPPPPSTPPPPPPPRPSQPSVPSNSLQIQPSTIPLPPSSLPKSSPQSECLVTSISRYASDFKTETEIRKTDKDEVGFRQLTSMSENSDSVSSSTLEAIQCSASSHCKTSSDSLVPGNLYSPIVTSSRDKHEVVSKSGVSVQIASQAVTSTAVPNKVQSSEVISRSLDWNNSKDEGRKIDFKPLDSSERKLQKKESFGSLKPKPFLNFMQNVKFDSLKEPKHKVDDKNTSDCLHTTQCEKGSPIRIKYETDVKQIEMKRSDDSVDMFKCDSSFMLNAQKESSIKGIISDEPAVKKEDTESVKAGSDSFESMQFDQGEQQDSQAWEAVEQPCVGRSPSDLDSSPERARESKSDKQADEMDRVAETNKTETKPKSLEGKDADATEKNICLIIKLKENSIVLTGDTSENVTSASEASTALGGTVAVASPLKGVVTRSRGRKGNKSDSSVLSESSDASGSPPQTRRRSGRLQKKLEQNPVKIDLPKKASEKKGKKDRKAQPVQTVLYNVEQIIDTSLVKKSDKARTHVETVDVTESSEKIPTLPLSRFLPLSATADTEQQQFTVSQTETSENKLNLTPIVNIQKIEVVGSGTNLFEDSPTNLYSNLTEIEQESERTVIHEEPKKIPTIEHLEVKEELNPEVVTDMSPQTDFLSKVMEEKRKMDVRVEERKKAEVKEKRLRDAREEKDNRDQDEHDSRERDRRERDRDRRDRDERDRRERSRKRYSDDSDDDDRYYRSRGRRRRERDRDDKRRDERRSRDGDERRSRDGDDRDRSYRDSRSRRRYDRRDSRSPDYRRDSHSPDYRSKSRSDKKSDNSKSKPQVSSSKSDDFFSPRSSKDDSGSSPLRPEKVKSRWRRASEAEQKAESSDTPSEAVNVQTEGFSTQEVAEHSALPQFPAADLLPDQIPVHPEPIQSQAAHSHLPYQSEEHSQVFSHPPPVYPAPGIPPINQIHGPPPNFQHAPPGFENGPPGFENIPPGYENNPPGFPHSVYPSGYEINSQNMHQQMPPGNFPPGVPFQQPPFQHAPGYEHLAPPYEQGPPSFEQAPPQVYPNYDYQQYPQPQNTPVVPQYPQPQNTQVVPQYPQPQNTQVVPQYPATDYQSSQPYFPDSGKQMLQQPFQQPVYVQPTVHEVPMTDTLPANTGQIPIASTQVSGSVITPIVSDSQTPRVLIPVSATSTQAEGKRFSAKLFWKSPKPSPLTKPAETFKTEQKTESSLPKIPPSLSASSKSGGDQSDLSPSSVLKTPSNGKKSVTEDPWDPNFDIVVPPKPVEVEPEPDRHVAQKRVSSEGGLIVPLKKQKHKLLDYTKADATSSTTQESEKTNNKAADSMKTVVESSEMKENVKDKDEVKDETPEPGFDDIPENIYLCERRKSKQMKRMVCDCTTSKEDRESGILPCGDDCLNKMLLIECGSRCPCGEYCQNKRFEKRQYSNVSRFRAGDKGWGLTANEELKCGQFVMEYVGEVLDFREFKNRTKLYAKMNIVHHYFMALTADEVIDATAKGNISRFINHSCDPNCETQKWTVSGELRIGFFVRRDIPPGEELTFNYQFEHYGENAQKCYCGASNCRGFIGTAKTMPLRKKKDKVLKKSELFEDEMLEEELEQMTALEGLRKKDHVLNFCRLMVRAVQLDHRMELLRILQETPEPACLRFFLDYHGLPLLWSWLADQAKETSKLKLKILQTLKQLPIKSKTVLEESKILPIIQLLSEPPIIQLLSEPEIEVESNSEVLPISSNQTPVSILAKMKHRLKDQVQPFKKRVTFADEATSSDSDISDSSKITSLLTGEAETKQDVSNSSSTKTDLVENSEISESKDETDSKDLVSGSNESDNKDSVSGSNELDNNDSVSGSNESDNKDSVSKSNESDNKDSVSKSNESDNKDSVSKSNESDKDSVSESNESTDSKDSISGSSESSEEGTSKSDKCDGVTTLLLKEKSDSVDMEEEDGKGVEEVKEVDVVKEELAALAKELIEQWSDLKDYKIPKKERMAELKRTEEELDARSKVPDTKGYKERFKDRIKKKLTSATKTRKTLLPTPDAMTKVERRQLFEAQVRAQDQMNAEIQRQQDEYLKQMYEQDPNYNPQFDPNLAQFIQQEQDPNQLVDPSMQYADMNAYVDPNTGYVDPNTGYVDPNTGYVDPNAAYVDPNTRFVDPNTGYVDPNAHFVDPNTGFVDPNTGFVDPNAAYAASGQYVGMEAGVAVDPAFQLQQGVVDVQQAYAEPGQQTAFQQYQVASHVQQQQAVMSVQQQQVLSQIQVVPGQPAVSTIPGVLPTVTEGQAVIPGVQTTAVAVAPVGSDQQATLMVQQVQQLHQLLALQQNLATMEMGSSPASVVTAALNEEDVPPPPSIPKLKLPPKWKSAKDSEGRTYYYHSVTKLTQWDVPTWDQVDDMELSPLEYKVKVKKKSKTTTAAADTSSDTKKLKDQFRHEMSAFVVTCLNPFRKPDCVNGRITSTEEFKHLARKLTHHVMAKELKHCRHVEDLEVNESVKGKAKDYVKKYMSRFTGKYQKEDDDF